MSGVVLALAGAGVYGVADFLGGVAARSARALVVAAGSQVVGLLVVVPAALLMTGEASGRAVALGAVAGLAGGLGVAAYYRGLAIGPMGVVSPLAAVVGAVVPLGAGLLMGERPGPLAMTGIVVAVLAVCLASMGHEPSRGQAVTGRRGVLGGPALGVVSGLGFGLFFVTIDATPADSGVWPLVAARGFVVVAVAAVLIPAALLGHGPRRWAVGVPWLLVAVTGLLDQGANVLFLLATRDGLLSVTGVLVSLYPVVVVVLAALLLGERLRPVQVVSAVAALLAAVLVALG